MIASWVIEEMQSLDLPDKRLNHRLHVVLSHLAERPTASIPAACGGYAEMAAAYRFFDNDRATLDNILEPHIAMTRRRIAAQPVVVLAQDTTELDLTRPEQQVRGAGPLDTDARQGALLHMMHAFTPDGTPLGTLRATAWVRDEDRPATTEERRAERRAAPIEDKESYRWLEMLELAGKEAGQYPETTFVCVADSEADIYEVFVAGATTARPAEWIVRACQNRALQPAQDGDASERVAGQCLEKQVRSAPVLFTQSITVRGRTAKIACETRGRRQPRQSRPAEVEVRAAQVTLRPPHRPDGKLPTVTLNVVVAREKDPPAGEPPVEWILLTSLPIESVEQVRQVIEYYCVRWMVEIFFRTLKSGCRVEERRFEQIDRLLTCLAVYLIVAWRTLYVCRLGRSCPEMSCETIFEPAEWKAVHRVVCNEPPPVEPPKLGAMVAMVAHLGGYVRHRGQSPPGPQTVWLGLQRTHDFALCWQRFGPDVKPRPELV
jgi:hypothetical protein